MVKMGTCVNLDLTAKFRMQSMDINLSDFFNKAMIAYLEHANCDGVKMIKINEELEEIKLKKEELTAREGTLLAIKLAHNEKIQQKQKEESIKAEKMVESIQTSGALLDNLR